MTVSNQATKCIYQGNASTIKWGFTFPVASPGDIAVYLTSPLGEQFRQYSGFTVDMEERNVIYPSVALDLKPLAAGWKITLARQTPLTQEVDFLRQGELDAEVLEDAYDKSLMQVQELYEKLQRVIQVPISQSDALNAEEFLQEVRDLRAQMQTIQTKILAVAALTKKIAAAAEDVAVDTSLVDAA